MNTQGGFWRSVLVLLALIAVIVGMTSVVYSATANAYFLDQALATSKRVTANETDFTYTIRVINQGVALTNARATVTSRSANTKIIDGEVQLGTLAAGVTVSSTDTYTLRQNRLVPFNPADLTWTIQGTAANTTPAANAGPDQTVRTGVLVTLDGTKSSDADGDALTYQWSVFSRPAGSTANLSSLVAGRPTFTPDRGGSYAFRLVVNDGKASSTYDEVRVSTTNSAPIANAGADRTVARGSTVTLDGSASTDPDFDALLYTWTLTTRPQGSTATLQGTANAKAVLTLDKAGTYIARLTVSDGSLTSSPDEVTLSTENSVPVADAGSDQTAIVGNLVTLNGSASHDVDDDALSYSWTWASKPIGSNSVLNQANTPSPFFQADLAGLYVGQLIVNDGFTNSAPDTTSVTITVPPNRAPNAVADSASTNGTTPVVINVLANDTDADAGTTLQIASFTQPANGGTVAAVTGGLQLTPATGFTGTTTFQYTVSDGSLTSSATVTVTVNAAANTAPTLDVVANRTINLGDSFNMRLAANDADVGDTLTFALDAGPTGALFNTPNQISWTPANTQVGTHTFAVSVRDAAGLHDAKSFTVTVVRVNRAPVFSNLNDDTTAVGASYTRVLTAIDPDGDTPIFELISGPQGLALSTGSISWQPTSAQRGTATVKVKVRDAAGASNVGLFRISVESNTAPSARDDQYAIAIGQTLTVPARGVLSNDADADGTALVSTRVSDPSVGTVTAFGNDGSFTFTAPTAMPPSTWGIERVWTGDAAGQLINSFATVADVNRDGYVDYLLTSQFTGPRAVDGRTGAPLWSFDSNGWGDCRFDFAAGSAAILADVDDDGQLEFVGSFGGCERDSRINAPGYAPSDRLIAIDAATGKVKWGSERVSREIPEARDGYGQPYPEERFRHVYDGTFAAAPSVARLGPHEKPTILMRKSISSGEGWYGDSTATGHGSGCRSLTGLASDEGKACRATILMNGDGTIRQVLIAPNELNQTGTGSWDPTREGYPFATDLDGDGQPEIVSGSDVWKRVSGDWTLLWHSKFEPLQTAAADLDGDGRAEVVHFLATPKTGAFGDPAFENFYGLIVRDGTTGAEIRRINLQLYWTAWLTIADADADGVPDFVLNSQGRVLVIGTDGVIKWTVDLPANGYNSDPGARSGAANAIVYDLDGDGVPEVITNSGVGLFIFNGRTGVLEAKFDSAPSVGGYSFATTTVLADFDGDGHADIFTQNVQETDRLSYRLYSGVGRSWMPAPKAWHQMNYIAGDVDDAGHVLFNGAVPKSFRNPSQIGVVKDARAALGTSFKYRATDGVSGSEATVFISITPSNAPPVITSKPAAAMLQSYDYTNFYQPAAYDPDAGDTITWSQTGAVQYVTFDPATGRITWPYTCGSWGFLCDWGKQLITLTATDSRGAQTTQTFVINITTASVTAPNVVGQQFDAALRALTAQRLVANRFSEVYNATPAGTILSQEPIGGTTMAAEGEVRLTVSKGKQPMLVPNVVGLLQGPANSRLTALGFTTGAITRVFSATVPRGEVISQSPAAGQLLAPDSVALTVSAGNGLALRLHRAVTTADQAIAFEALAVDENGVETPATGVTYAITAKAPQVGSLPTVVGNNIVPAANTRGGFTIKVTNSSGASVSTTFGVSAAPIADADSNAAAFARMAEAMDDISKLAQQAKAALAANNVPLQKSLLTQMVTRWRQIDMDDLRISVPMTAETGFIPLVSQMATYGVTSTPDDLLIQRILKDADADLKEWIDALRARHTSLNELNRLADQFATRAGRLNGLEVSEWGAVNNASNYQLLLARRIPDLYEAIMDELAVVVGMPATRVAANRPVASNETLLASAGYDPASEIHLYSTLVELSVAQATEWVVDKVMEDFNEKYRNGKKFATDIMYQAAWGAAAVASVSHLRAYVQGQDIEEVVAGASLSFREFETPYSFIEGPWDLENPELNEVWIIGPRVFQAVQPLVDKIRDTMKYRKTLDPVGDDGKYRNADQIKKDLKSFDQALRELQAQAEEFSAELGAVKQDPTGVDRPCLFSGSPDCGQLVYEAGFATAYQYTPPPGFESFSGLPLPVVFLVYNYRSNTMYFASPPFFPTPYSN